MGARMTTERTKKWQGSKWIRPEKRLSIYHRDRFRCSWCDRHVREIALCLDHIIRVADGGTNKAENLVTSCFLCNRDRSLIPPVEWPLFLWTFWDRPEGVVRDVVVRARETPLDIAWGRQAAQEKPPWLVALRARASTAWQALELYEGEDFPFGE